MAFKFLRESQGLRSENTFDNIHQAIIEYCSYERQTLLENILTDFNNQCNDVKSMQILEEIIGYYQQSSPATTPGICVKKVCKPHLTVNSPMSHFSPSSQRSSLTSPASHASHTSFSPLTSHPSHPTHSSHSTHPTHPTQPTQPLLCTSIIKSGMRKGQSCGIKVHADGLCKRHQPKVCVESSGNAGISPTNGAEEKCPALLKVGVRKGQICGACVPNGEIYCGKHKVVKCMFKLENGDYCGRSISLHSTSQTHCRIHVKNELSLDTRKFVTSLNRFGNMEHKYSGLVFENKKVVGAQHPTGTIVSNLNDDDLECVITYGLPIDPCFSSQMSDYLNKRKRKESKSNDSSEQ